MKVMRNVLLVGLVVIYAAFFWVQDKKGQGKESSLGFALPASFYTIATGYLKQLSAEILFIRNSVFLGGLPPGTPPANYASTLANNFAVMTSLYPRFTDPYYFCQGFLPHISPDSASRTNAVLATGILAYPNKFILRFFQGVNYFLSMNEPIKGAKVFEAAAKLPDAPQLFAHLAAILSAQGGEITAGLISLKAMLAAEQDKDVKARYQREIDIFHRALEVQTALEAYSDKFGIFPDSLSQLVPEFIVRIPEIEDLFVLVYKSPTLSLQRPDRRKKK